MDNVSYMMLVNWPYWRTTGALDIRSSNASWPQRSSHGTHNKKDVYKHRNLEIWFVMPKRIHTIDHVVLAHPHFPPGHQHFPPGQQHYHDLVWVHMTCTVWHIHTPMGCTSTTKHVHFYIYYRIESTDHIVVIHSNFRHPGERVQWSDLREDHKTGTFTDTWRHVQWTSHGMSLWVNYD